MGIAVKRTIQVVLLSGALAISSTATALAVDTSSPTATPTPQISAKSKPVKQGPTQAQKDAIAAARLAYAKAYAKANANAQNGFDRAIADAQAIRDQAILAAGTDKNAPSTARKDYRTSYWAILNIYGADLKNAKTIFQNAIAALKLSH